MVFVVQSPLGAEGSFFFNISSFGRRFVVAEDNNAEAAHDKPFIVADTFTGSPNRDDVYITWPYAQAITTRIEMTGLWFFTDSLSGVRPLPFQKCGPFIARTVHDHLLAPRRRLTLV